MENSYETVNGNGPTANGQCGARHSSYQPCIQVSLPWLDLRVFYVRVNKCEIDDDSTPEHLTLNHIPLTRDTLLEINGVRTSIYSDGVSSLLRRDRFDKKSEEATFVSTDSIRVTGGGVKFEVFDKDVLVLSGVLELCDSNGFIGESKNNNNNKIWVMNCESDIVAGTSFLKGNQYSSLDSASPMIEVYVAGSFSGSPIILTKTLQLNSRRKLKGMLDVIPENETSESQKEVPSGVSLQISEYPNDKPENGDYNNLYSGIDYFEGEDRELSWFNSGVRVGVGIGLSICLGVGMGVGLMVRTYQGTTRTFRRRLL